MHDSKLRLLPAWLCLAMTIGAAAYAGPECRSELPAHLKPVTASSPLSWSAEIESQAGWLTNDGLDRTLAHGQLMLGAQYAAFSSRFRVYGEGSFKGWYKSDTGPGLGGTGTTWADNRTPDKTHWGPRAAFAEYHGENAALSVGLQAVSLGEALLLDERALGLAANDTWGPLTLRLAAGTVTADFARMQDHCAARHAYSVVRGGRLDLLGDALGETNFAGISLELAPTGRRAKPSQEAEDDEFEAIQTGSPRRVRRVGLVYLQEFGDGFGRYRQFFGATTTFRGPLGLEAQLEVVYQDAESKTALGYLVRLDRDFGWRSGASTRVSASFVGSHAIDEHARFSPAFANLFLGEVMRLDAIRAPLAFAHLEQTLAVKTRPYLRAFYVAQLRDEKTSELDLELGVRFLRGARIFAAQGFIRSSSLPSPTRTSRLGLRWAF